MVEGTIGKWLKQPGDKVERYEPLVEVITDKVTMEVPSPVSGSLLRILAQEGETIPMGAPLAEVETADGTAEAARVPTTATETIQSPMGATPAPTGEASRPAGTIGFLTQNVRMVGPTGGGITEEARTEEPASALTLAPPVQIGIAPLAPVQTATSQTPAQTSNGSTRLSPAVRRLAREHGIDVSQISGSGMGGRISREDVAQFIESGAYNAVAPALIPEASVSPSTKQGENEDEVHIPLTPVRRMIAEAMVRSVSQIPHAWSTIEVDVNNLVTLRNGLRAGFQQAEGIDLTYLPLIIKMVVESLKENPTLNATWGGDKIILKKRINLGIAVAAPNGLVVPVIHDADRLSISGLAHSLSDLTERARQNKLTLLDVQGGTFTLNNTGALGSLVSQPIVNYPQAAIMTTEVIQKRPVVINDAIAIRSMMNLCMSFDHRINDGAESSAFLQSVKRRLESIRLDTSVY